MQKSEISEETHRSTLLVNKGPSEELMFLYSIARSFSSILSCSQQTTVVSANIGYMAHCSIADLGIILLSFDSQRWLMFSLKVIVK